MLDYDSSTSNKSNSISKNSSSSTHNSGAAPPFSSIGAGFRILRARSTSHRSQSRCDACEGLPLPVVSPGVSMSLSTVALPPYSSKPATYIPAIHVFTPVIFAWGRGFLHPPPTYHGLAFHRFRFLNLFLVLFFFPRAAPASDGSMLCAALLAHRRFLGPLGRLARHAVVFTVWLSSGCGRTLICPALCCYRYVWNERSGGCWSVEK